MIISIIFLIIIYLVYNQVYILENNASSRNHQRDFLTGNKEKRIKAIASAGQFIKLDVTNNIWGNISLSNKYCYLKLSYSGNLITVMERGTEKWHQSFSYCDEEKPIENIWKYYESENEVYNETDNVNRINLE